MVKYAYYTSYDERGVNAFFNLVPIQYKIDNGYVSNIKEALDQFKNGGDISGYSSIAQTGDDPQSMSFPSIRLTIARNMWDDPNIVPKYNNRKTVLRVVIMILYCLNLEVTLEVKLLLCMTVLLFLTIELEEQNS